MRFPRREPEGQQDSQHERHEQQDMPQQRQRIRHQMIERTMSEAMMMPIMAGHLGKGVSEVVLAREETGHVKSTNLQ